MGYLAGVEITYDDKGEVYSNIITYNNGKIQVLPRSDFAPTAEFQRSDELIQALVKARK